MPLSLGGMLDVEGIHSLIFERVDFGELKDEAVVTDWRDNWVRGAGGENRPFVRVYSSQESGGQIVTELRKKYDVEVVVTRRVVAEAHIELYGFKQSVREDVWELLTNHRFFTCDFSDPEYSTYPRSMFRADRPSVFGDLPFVELASTDEEHRGLIMPQLQGLMGRIPVVWVEIEYFEATKT